MSDELHGVAIIGIAGRFPNAESIEQFWRNTVEGVDCTRELTSEEIVESGVDPKTAKDPSYIRRCALLEHVDLFDANFFDYLPNEAAVLDPQARVFLECVQLALDDAGCDPDRFHGSIGVYAGKGLNNYLLKNLLRRPGSFEDILDFQTIIYNDKDFISTQVNYKFNLTGPGVCIQSACSTSLVAIQLAYQALLTYQCDVAISGGTHLINPRTKGMLYKEGEIYSPDGVCRPFDKNASGTLFGEGVGVVVLKRLEDALNDRDHIYGVIRGAAINNDGSQKVSYAAPSVKGQAEVIAMAQTLADVQGDDIGYIEAHGTGTKLGDPIEIRALTQAFRLSTNRRGFCAIGSGKAMIGHLDVAAGIAGLIRATLALHHKTIPSTLHYTAPNPELKLEETPFYVQAESCSWQDNGKPRIAAVSSFGVGGTNAHAIIQEAPALVSAPTEKQFHLLPLSAKTPRSLDAQTTQLIEFIKKNPEISLADLAFTLQAGRRQFAYRKVAICHDVEDAAKTLDSERTTAAIRGMAPQSNKPVFFMFSGQGSQHLNMCRDLYNTEEVFKQIVDTCAKAVEDIVGYNFLDVVFSDENAGLASEKIKQTCIAQPALYAVECGLARLWSQYGVYPEGLIGHSIGEFVAAYFAGVFSLEDGARIVAMRGKLMQQMETGAMLSLRNSAEDVEAVLLDSGVSISVVNGPKLTVVGGTTESINKLKRELDAEEIPANLLHTSHAFHTSMMDNAVQPFVEEVGKYTLNKPNIPFISNITGDWITPEQAVDSNYWGKHLRSTVQFAKGIDTLCSNKSGILLEVGPSQALTILCQEQTENVKAYPVVPSARHPKQKADDTVYFYRAFGGLWVHGGAVDLTRFYADEARRKIPLPGYAFDRKRFWIDSSLSAGFAEASQFEPVLQAAGTSASTQAELPSSMMDTSSESIPAIVTEVWRELLGCESVEPKDSFYDLGGHSLVAAKMLAVLRNRCGINVSLELLNANPTFDEFCSAIEPLAGDQNSGYADPSHPLKRLDSQRWPLSPQQERLWFFHEYVESDPIFNLAQTIVIQGKIDIDKLKAAVDYVLNSHEAFSTVFNYEENGKVYATRADTSIIASVVHLERESEDDREMELVERIIRKNSVAKNFSAISTEAILYVLEKERVALVLYAPHINTDGLSFNIFYEQLNEAYQNLLSGKAESAGLDIPYQYSDYVLWLLEHPKKDSAEAIAFWQEYLKGVPDLIQLPTSYPRPLALSSHGSAIHFSLTETQSTQVKSLCKRLKITPFIFFLSQLYIALWKYTGQSTHVVGAPYANRANKAVEGIVGFFLDMIPIRGDIDSSLPFTKWVEQIGRSFARAWDHFEIGLDKIVEASGVSRHTNAHPLFQVTFTYLSYLDNSRGNQDYSMQQVMVDRGVSEYDLSLYMWENEEFTGLFEFATDLFNSDAIERIIDHFMLIIDWVLSDSDKALSELSIVDANDMTVINAINRTDRPEFLDQNFVDLFSRSVAQFSAKTALKANGVGLSYEELNEATNRMAVQLRQRGIAKGSFVGVYTSRGLNTLVSLVAILKSGAAYIPLDPGFPTDRLRYIIEDSGLKVLLVDQENSSNELLRVTDVQAIVLDNRPAVEPLASYVQEPIDPKALAYVLYTSGSTGRPKGVPIRHDSLANFLLYVSELPGISSSDNLLAITTTSFDISFLELLLPLLNGATVVIADSYTARDGEALGEFIEAENITYVQATPATWTLLLDSGWKGKPGIKMLSGGEALKSDLAARLIAAGDALWNAYGPTECTIWSSFARINTADGEPSIGVPMANTSYYVLDENNNPVPPGIVGELAIGGVALSPGYNNREDLTREVFIEVSVPGVSNKALVYKTGDLAQLTRAGEFRCLGRKDFQIKIRGFRIELGEIESQLSTYPNIDECCCIVIEASATDKQLVAYYRASAPIDSDKLRTHLQSRLPRYMIPGFFVYIEAFPKTANQKIDRKKLPPPGKVESVDASSTVLTPATIVESKIVAIWKGILKQKDIGVEDNFFDLGGHSLVATQVIKLMNETIQSSWQVRDLFLYPTVRGLAKKIGDVEPFKLPLLFPIQTQGQNKPFFLVAGVYADQYRDESGQLEYERGFFRYFSNIINIVGRERPIYGFRARGIFTGEVVHDSIYDMAQEYVLEIKKISPGGPYLIGGECLGGNLAYEVAQQLRRRGDEVDLLVLLDTIKPSLKSQLIYKQFFYKRMVSNILRGEKFIYGGESALYANKLVEYRVERYEGNVLLIANEDWNRRFPMLHWDFKTTPYMSIEIVKGNHTTRLRDYGELTAQALRKHLAYLE